MTNGWDGADPTMQNDGPAVDYELATRYVANADITISAIRVWCGSGSASVTGREGRIWSTGGTVLATATMDASLPLSQWTAYNLNTPLDISDGTTFDVSYETLQFYGAISGDYPNDSSDALVTATQGRFSTTPEDFPTNTTATFYGIDVIYTANIGGNQAPEVTSILVETNGLAITTSATVVDESPSTVTIRWNWGDSSTTNTGAGVVTSSHTYAQPGMYAVMATATDSAGLMGSFATPIQLTEITSPGPDESWIDDIFDHVVSDIQASGYFDKVNTHEPKRKPGTGLTAAVWVQEMSSLPQASGLGVTSALLVFTARLYSNMFKEPQDMIDPQLLKATSNLMRRYHDDFDFSGSIRNVDLLGISGTRLRALAGYVEMDSALFRVFDITIPCIVNDVWPQIQ